MEVKNIIRVNVPLEKSHNSVKIKHILNYRKIQAIFGKIRNLKNHNSGQKSKKKINAEFIHGKDNKKKSNFSFIF